MRVAVTGASGLIGSALVRSLQADGHNVLRLVRRPARSQDEVSWDPYSGTVDTEPLLGVDAVVNLAGSPIPARRWTEADKRRLRDSRVSGTHTISRAVATLDPRPRVLVSASAIGYYAGIHEPVDESAPPGSGFFSEVVVEWERAARPARDAGVRVVNTRTGIVVASEGGAFGRMLTIFRLGLGGRLGDGRQYWSFISLTDAVRALRFLMEREDLRDAVNLTAPNHATNAEVTSALAAAVHRPAVFAVPGFALRTALGEFASEVLDSRLCVDAGR